MDDRLNANELEILNKFANGALAQERDRQYSHLYTKVFERSCFCRPFSLRINAFDGVTALIRFHLKMSYLKDRHRVSDVIDLTEDTCDKQIQMENRKISPDVKDLTGEGAPMDLPMDREVSSERISSFRRKVSQAFINSRREIVSVKRLTEIVNADNDEIFSENEVNAALKQMTDANQVMVAEGLVFRI